MTDVDFLSPRKDQCILTTHNEVISRGSRETGVVNGNALTPSEPADMIVHVGAGRIKIAGTPMDTVAGAGTITTAHVTLPRIDVPYRDPSGNVQMAIGTPAVIEDPKGLGDWKGYTSPTPPEDIPDGAILGAVWVPAECTAITAANIWMFAGGVGDIATSIGTPGLDNRPASEKAVRDVLSETAPAAKGVTNGDLHDHTGGDGDQINHTTLSNIGSNNHSTIDAHLASTSNPHGVTAAQAGADITTSTMHAATSKTMPADADELGLLDSAASYGLNKLTWANLKAALLATLHSATSKTTPVDTDEIQLLDSAASYGQKKLTWANLKTTLNALYAPIAKGVTGGDSHDHSSGGGAQIDHGSCGGLTDDDHTNYLNNTRGDARYPLKSLLTTAGDIIYATGASAWARLAKGATGQRLVQGASAPVWTTGVFGADFPFGDGSAVIDAQSAKHRIPIASKITKAYIRSDDTDGVLKAGSVTCSIYVHDYNGAIGSAVDSFVLSSASSYAETGLSITVAAGKYVTVILSGITTVEQILLSLELEAT